MAVVIRLRQEHVDAIVAHALRDAPIECCGIIAAKDGRVTATHPANNAEASPYRFSVDFRDQRRIEEAIDAAGDDLAGFYHSHTGSPAHPSPTDIRMMGTFFGPPYVHFVVSVADRTKPDLRVFHIAGGGAIEHDYAVEP